MVRAPVWKSWNDLRRNSPVLVRIGLSLVAVVVTVALALSVSSYLFFQRKYDQELEALHRVLLGTMESEIRSEVLDAAKTIYMNLSMDVISPAGLFFSADDVPAGNAERLYWTYHELNTVVSRHTPVVNAIHLYYHKSRLFLSSLQGVKYEADSQENVRGRRWWDLLSENRLRSAWLEPEAGVVTSLQSYPLLADPASAQVVVAIDFRLEALKAILERFSSPKTGTTLLVSRTAQTVAATSGQTWTNAFLKTILAAPPERQASGFPESVGGVPSLVTALPVADSDWLLVNSTPLDQLHAKDAELFVVLVLISLAVMLLGIGVSVPLMFRIYSPLSALVRRARGLVGPSHPRPATVTDEYGEIDVALEGLAATLQSQRPALQHERASRLLEGAEVASDLPSQTVAGVLRLRGGGSAKHRLVEELEGRGEPLRMATALAGSSIGLIVDASDPQRLAAAAEAWVALAKEVSGADAWLSVGTVSDSEGLAHSFREALQLAEFRFFHPDVSVFLNRPDLLASDPSRALPSRVLTELSAALEGRQLTKVDALLAEVVQFVQTPGVASDRARNELYRVVRTLSSAVPDVRVEALLAEARSVVEWRDAVSALAADVFAQVENRTEDRNTVLVQRVRAYVSDHLAGELSLDRVSAAVGISPSYLSKLFKGVSGVNFVAFVTEQRVTEARRLLQQSRATVQEVGRLVGFHTPAYFIHQFRARFGVTPYEFRRGLGPSLTTN